MHCCCDEHSLRNDEPSPHPQRRLWETAASVYSRYIRLRQVFDVVTQHDHRHEPPVQPSDKPTFVLGLVQAICRTWRHVGGNGR
jgi:hypothetical protein